ncbi:MAG: phage major capsid protein, partial [Syntrophales bacterium]|nr:phage major capsid protein [Syntrophales bacterium]
MEELKKTIEALGKAFEQFKAENDTRLKEIQAKGGADPLLTEKVEKINAEISKISDMKKQLEALETAVARGGLPGGGGQIDKAKVEHAKAWEKWFRKGAEAGLRDLEIQAGASTLSDPDGGYLVPETTEQTIDRVAQTV